jgi:hypothetical protein
VLSKSVVNTSNSSQTVTATIHKTGRDSNFVQMDSGGITEAKMVLYKGTTACTPNANGVYSLTVAQGQTDDISLVLKQTQDDGSLVTWD